MIDNISIGIIGGMGPQAGLFAHDLILEHARLLWGDQTRKFPIVSLLTLPIEDFSRNAELSNKALEQIVAGINLHNFQVFDNVILACNTAHILTDEIVKRTNIKLKSLIKISQDEIRNRNVSCVGVVCSPVSHKINLHNFDNCFVIKPNKEQSLIVANIIHSLIAGVDIEILREKLIPIVNKLFYNGAEAVVLGCTELEMIMHGNKDVRLIMPLDLVVSSIMNEKGH